MRVRRVAIWILLCGPAWTFVQAQTTTNDPDVLLKKALRLGDLYTIAVTAGTLIDPDTGTEKGNQTILIDGRKIVAVGPERTHEKYVARLKRAWDAGVEVVFGTDVMADVKGRTRGELAIEYVDSFREAGINPSDTLRSMTTQAAALLDVHKVRGSIREGMAADLVATPVNPLRDIDGLKKINFVMKDGQIYRTP